MHVNHRSAGQNPPQKIGAPHARGNSTSNVGHAQQMRRKLLLRDLVLLRHEAYAHLEAATTRLPVDETELDDVWGNLDQLDVVVPNGDPSLFQGDAQDKNGVATKRKL
jgi:hypothetical protein